MPLYDFRCPHCNTTIELLVRSDERPDCRSCGADLERQISRPQAPGTSAAFIQQSRAQAAREGHFSNFSPSERPKIR